MSTILQIQGTDTSEPSGSRQIGPFTINGVTQVDETLKAKLAIGDNTFPVPEGAVGVIVLPPAGGGASVALKLRTDENATDGGLVLNTNGLPLVYPFPATPPIQIILNSSQVLSGVRIIFI